MSETITVDQAAIAWELENAGVNARLLDADGTAAVELAAGDEDGFWNAIASAAASTGRDSDFAAARAAVQKSDVPEAQGHVRLTFPGFAWDSAGAGEKDGQPE